MASMEMREANGGDCLSETASSGLAAAMEMTRKMGVSQAEGNGAKNDMSVDVSGRETHEEGGDAAESKRRRRKKKKSKAGAGAAEKEDEEEEEAPKNAPALASPNGGVVVSKSATSPTAPNGRVVDEKPAAGAEEGDEDGGDADGPESGAGGSKKKKKNRSRKKKVLEQTDPPSIPVSKLFPDGIYPVWEEQNYNDDNLWRLTSAEKREQERLESSLYNDVRKAAEVHRQVRKYMRKYIKPGLLMTDICETLENLVRTLIEENGLQAGIAFPTGCSLNWYVLETVEGCQMGN